MSLSYSVYRFFNFRDEIVKSILFSRKCRSYRLLWCVSYEINVHKSKFYVEILHKLNLWDEIPLSRTPNYLFLLLRPYESNIGDKFGATVVYSTTKERTNWNVTTFNGTSSRIKMILLVTLCVCVDIKGSSIVWRRTFDMHCVRFGAGCSTCKTVCIGCWVCVFHGTSDQTIIYVHSSANKKKSSLEITGIWLYRCFASLNANVNAKCLGWKTILYHSNV